MIKRRSVDVACYGSINVHQPLIRILERLSWHIYILFFLHPCAPVKTSKKKKFLSTNTKQIKICILQVREASSSRIISPDLDSIGEGI